MGPPSVASVGLPGIVEGGLLFNNEPGFSLEYVPTPLSPSLPWSPAMTLIAMW